MALAGSPASMQGLCEASAAKPAVVNAVKGNPLKLPAVLARWKLSSNPFVPPITPSGPAGFTKSGSAEKLCVS